MKSLYLVKRPALTLSLILCFGTFTTEAQETSQSELEDLANVYILPLISKAQESLDTNPYLYSHSTGLDPLKKIVRSLRKYNMVERFNPIPLGTAWKDIDSQSKKRFLILAEGNNTYQQMRNIYGDSQYRYSIENVWQQSRTNPDWRVLCCGESCSFSFYLGEKPDLMYLNVKSVKKSSICGLSFSLGSVNNPYRTPFEDPGCKGSIESLSTGNRKIDENFKMAYRKLLFSLDPATTYQRSEKTSCDI